MHALVITMINLHAKLEVHSLTHSKDMTLDPNFTKAQQ